MYPRKRLTPPRDVLWIWSSGSSYVDLVGFYGISTVVGYLMPNPLYTYVGYLISFQTFFFVQAFRIVVDSWKFSMLLLYILWDDWSIFMISGSNEQLQQQLVYTLLKPDCQSSWILKKESGREDTLEEPYAIKFCFNLEKRMGCFRLLLDHLAWIEHQFLSGIRDSTKAGSLWGMMRGVR